MTLFIWPSPIAGYEHTAMLAFISIYASQNRQPFFASACSYSTQILQGR
jgi:hypothetical protein